VNEPLQAGALLVERKDAPRPHGKTTGKRKLPTALEMVQASRAYTTYVEKEVVAREPGQKLQVNPAMLTAGSFNLPYMNYPNPLATTMMTGVPSVRGDPRPNDKYTLMPTSIVCLNSMPLAVLTGLTSVSSSCYGFSCYVSGSPKATFARFGCDTHGTIDYTTKVYYDCGMMSGDFLTRPLGVTLTMSPVLLSTTHPMLVFAMPVVPFTLSTFTGGTGFPIKVVDYPSAANANSGARGWIVNPGDKLHFSCLPMDNRGFDFVVGNDERDLYDATGKQAWSGWFVWGYTFSTATGADSLLCNLTYTEEIMQLPFTNTAYAYPKNTPNASATMMDQAINEVSHAKDLGMNAVKEVMGAASGIADLYRTLHQTNSTYQSATDAGVTDSLGYRGAQLRTMPIARIIPPNVALKPPTQVDEEKYDDQVLVVTPKQARRPSIAHSLTSKR